jgi:ADP-heptose:LPS heptosyltransferase
VSGTTKMGQMLVAAPVRWDEASFSVPALRALVASGLEVGVLCEERQVPFWERIGGIRVIGFPPKPDVKKIAAGLGGGWSGALIWEAGIAADMILRAQIAKRIGPETKALRKVTTHPVNLEKEPGPVEHRVRFYLSLVEKLGVTTSRAEFFAPLESSAPPVDGNVMLCPDSDLGVTYEWPLERWVELAGALKSEGAKLTIAGLSGTRGKGRLLAEKLGESERFLEARPLAGALDLFAAHQVVIASESSLPHVAAFAGATCVTLFGPGDPTSRRPLGRQHGIARLHVECAPCFLEKCPMDLRCQNELTVDRVMGVVAAVL